MQVHVYPLNRLDRCPLCASTNLIKREGKVNLCMSYTSSLSTCPPLRPPPEVEGEEEEREGDLTTPLSFPLLPPPALDGDDDAVSPPPR